MTPRIKQALAQFRAVDEQERADERAQADFHDDKPSERADRFVTTTDGDLDVFGRPLRPGT